MAQAALYPAPGCIVEFIEGNNVQIAMVLEESAGKLRLLLPSRRELKLSSNRLLPWSGPQHMAASSREEAVKTLERHKELRESRQKSLDLQDLWELAQGEVERAPVKWFAELLETEPDNDFLAAIGRALLECKSHFKYQSGEFQIYDAEVVEKRLAEAQAKEEKEALISSGSAFLRSLWEIANNHGKNADQKNLPVPQNPEIVEKIRKILFKRVKEPDSQEDLSLWQILSKGLPDVPHLPFQLLVAWGLLPKHYNFWLLRADYEANPDWALIYQQEIDEICSALSMSLATDLQLCDLPFLSIDNADTIDIDDAFFLEKAGENWRLVLTFAAPALNWPFGGVLDKAILHRGTSLYFPEGNLHMLPEKLGIDSYSLLENAERPALCMEMLISPSGEIINFSPFLAKVRLKANLCYHDVQEVLESGGNFSNNPALPYADMLQMANELAQTLENARIARGAIILLRKEPILKLEAGEEDVVVKLMADLGDQEAHRIVSEMMVAGSAAIADWADERQLPMIYRTQNVALPKDYAGVWEDPAEIARIMKALAPSLLETRARPHAALAVQRYAPITSPLRRYGDLLNEAQVLSQLSVNAPRWNGQELEQMLERLSINLETVNQAQRFRPRYWKLLYFRQQGEKIWWSGIVTEENEMMITVSLPEQGLFVRGKRQLFDERIAPGVSVKVRLGKINPLYNDIHILEAQTVDA